MRVNRARPREQAVSRSVSCNFFESTFRTSQGHQLSVFCNDVHAYYFRQIFQSSSWNPINPIPIKEKKYACSSTIFCSKIVFGIPFPITFFFCIERGVRGCVPEGLWKLRHVREKECEKRARPLQITVRSVRHREQFRATVAKEAAARMHPVLCA